MPAEVPTTTSANIVVADGVKALLEKDIPPTKLLGKPGECPCARMWITKENGRQFTRICLEKGFDWRINVKPILPGTPDWCPATHFGYLESGCMEVQMQDGSSKTIQAGESYFVAPGHIPILHEDSVMVEFSQDETYTKKEFIEKKAE